MNARQFTAALIVAFFCGVLSILLPINWQDIGDRRAIILAAQECQAAGGRPVFIRDAIECRPEK